jgi:alcohol dehydrogenase class IV
MRPITLLQPPRLVVGQHCAAQCAIDLAAGGFKRVLLVSSSQVMPALDGVLQTFDAEGVEVIHAAPVDREPSVGDFESRLAVLRRAKVQAVVGIGGGSVIDVAKLLAALIDSPREIREVFGLDRLTGRALRLVCLPTTAGTGAEVSPNAILLDEADQLKKGVVSHWLVPDAAYIDPLLTRSVPPSVTAATGMDALTHCIEAYANRFAHPVVDMFALQGIRLIAGHLRRAVENGADCEARTALAVGSVYGGLCLGPVNTAAVHALSYPLGGRFHIAHGVANSLLLSPVLKFNVPAAPERYAEVAMALGVMPGNDVTATAEAGVAFLTALSRDCGLPQTLSEIGIPRAAIPEMARAAMQVTRLLKNNLRPVAEADAIAIYESAF